MIYKNVDVICGIIDNFNFYYSFNFDVVFIVGYYSFIIKYFE